jgi:hypothetical protein
MSDVIRITIAGQPARVDATVAGAQVTGNYSALEGDYGASTDVSGLEIMYSGRFDNPQYYSA